MGDAAGKNDNEIASEPPPDGKFLVILFGFTIFFLKPTLFFLYCSCRFCFLGDFFVCFFF